MDARAPNRRRFLKQSAALTGLAIGAGADPVEAQRGAGAAPAPAAPTALQRRRAYGERSAFETAARQTTTPEGHTPLHAQMGIITPSSLHYVVSHGYDPPALDPRAHRLLLHGLVDRPLIFTLDELKRLPSVSRIHFIECAGNTSTSDNKTLPKTVQYTHGWTSCSVWSGVPLSLLLKEAGVQTAGKWIVAEGSEAGKLTKSIPIEKALDDVIVAYGQNGEAIRPENGYPLRLIVPGFEGVNNIKWLRRIKVVDEPVHGRSESTGYPVIRPAFAGKSLWFDFELGPKSVIIRPGGGAVLPGPGFYEITGLAWSGGGAIRKVDVSTDAGRTWTEAQLHDPVLKKAHTMFTLPWTWDGRETMLLSRCADERGDIQPTVSEIAALWGVPPAYFQSPTTRVFHFNPIYPWRVKPDGHVESALFT
jgi:sulfane dehydrogenase subunit SoxC